jgi:hypothetical protein
MQAAKIKIGDSYAVHVAGELVSCRVTEVTTVRKGAHPSDFKHTISGYVAGSLHTFTPDGVLGPYQDYAELVERKAIETARAKAEADAKDKAAIDLIALFFKLTNQPVPTEKYGHIFDTSYGGSVSIRADGVKLLLDALDKRPSLKLVTNE